MDALNYHTGPYAHRCPHCPATFASNRDLGQHCREEHDYNGTQCPLCLRELSRNWAMYRHVRNVHRFDIHPGQGRQVQRARRRQQHKVRVGQRRTEGTHQQARQAVAELQVIPDDHEEDNDGPVIDLRGIDHVVEIGEAFETAQAYQEYVETDLTQHYKVMGADPAFEYAPHNQDFDPALFDGWKLCPDQNCFAVFNDEEGLLGHLHLEHWVPYSASCECLECVARRIAGEFNPIATQAQDFQNAVISPPASPELQLESRLQGLEMNVDKDSGIDDTSIKSSPSVHPLHKSYEPIESLFGDINAPTAPQNSGEPAPNQQSSHQGNDPKIGIDWMRFDLGHFNDNPPDEPSEEVMAWLLGDWDDVPEV